MSKINIRESLNRLDLQTDNKYDLRNTYDCSNISDDKKKKLAEALNKNASAKTISRILDESYGGYDYYLIEFFVDGRRYEEEYTDTSAKEALERFKEDYSDDDYKIREIYKLTNEGYIGLGYPFIHKNESLKEDIDDFDPKYDARYEVNSYYANNYSGLEDDLYTNDFEEVKDWVWEKIQNGGYIEVIDRERGKSVRLDPDSYDWESDDAYRVLDDLEEVSPLSEKYEDDKEDLDEEQLYKIVCKSGASEWPFESALSYEDAEKIVDYYNGRWIDERGFEWSMEIEEDDESTERAYPFDESLKEDYDDKKSVEFSDFWIWAKTKDGKWKLYDAASEQEDVSSGLRNAKADKRFVDTKVTKNGERPDGTKNYNVLTSESLKEDFEDEIDFEESDFNDGEVEEGDTFIEDGTEWCWIERIAGPIHLDFDNWAVWSARNWDQVQYAWHNIDIETRKEVMNSRDTDLFIEVINSVYDEAEVAYFVVDEDTGFIDWGPVETSTEAQDFLNSKVEDYENDEEYEEVEIEEESLKESKAIKNDDDFEVTLHYDDIGNGKEYDYKLGYDEVVSYLKELAWANGDGPEGANEDEYLEWVMDNFDELSDRYESNVLNYFESEASQYEYDHRNDEP